MFFTSGLTKLGSCPTRMAEMLVCGLPDVPKPGGVNFADIVRRLNDRVLSHAIYRSLIDACAAELFVLLTDPLLNSRCCLAAEDLFSLESGTTAYLRTNSRLQV